MRGVLIFNGMKIAHSLVAELVRSMLREGLKKKREDRPRRITGSPSVIETWATEVTSQVSIISGQLDEWYGLNSDTRFEDVSATPSEPLKRWHQILKDDPHLVDVSDLYALHLNTVSYRIESAPLGLLSDLTGDENDRASVCATISCNYERPGHRESKGMFIPGRSSSPLTPDERQSGEILAGTIVIKLGTEVILKYDKSSKLAGNIVGYRVKRESADLLRSINHEVLHLTQYLSDRVFSAGRYGRYGSAGDRPGHESSASRAGREEHTESIAIEPDAYAISIITQARERFMSWLLDELNLATEKEDTRNQILDREYRTDNAKSFVESQIAEEMKMQDADYSHAYRSDAFSGAGSSKDVKRYIRMRSLNAIEKIVRGGDGLVKSYLENWISSGWKRPAFTPYLEAERKRKADLALDQERADAYIADVESLLAKMDQPMLDAVLQVADSLDIPGDPKYGQYFGMQFYARWNSKPYASRLADSLSSIVEEIDSKREEYTGLVESPWIRSYIDGWIDCVFEDMSSRGGNAFKSDPLIPSRGADIQDVGLGIRFEDYRGKTMSESSMRSLVRRALTETTRALPGEFSSNPVEIAIVQPQDPDYTQDSTGKEIPYINLLGEVPDAEIADQYNVPVSTVWLDRKHRGIPPFTRTARRDDEARFADLFGTMPDEELAEMTGMTLSAIKRARASMNIPPYRPGLPYEDLLGTMSDSDLGRIYDVNRQTIHAQRKKRGIPPYSG